MFAFAVRNLLSRKARSALALAGLTVAIAGMVGLFAVAGGLDDAVEEAFGQMDGLTALQPGAPVPLFSTLPARWGPRIEALPGVSRVMPELWSRVNLIDGETIISPPRFLLGFDVARRAALRKDIYRDALTDGRFLAPGDEGTLRCVISRPIAEEFGVGLGDTLTVGGAPLEVVGLYEIGSLLLDVGILVDQETFRGMTRFDPATVSDFYIEPAVGQDLDELSDRIRAELADERYRPWTPSTLAGLGASDRNPVEAVFDGLDRLLRGAKSSGSAASGANPSEDERIIEDGSGEPEAAIELRDAADWATQFDRFTEDLDLFLTILTTIGVLIAVLGIVNTMLMSVSERIIEFGILKANGWSRTDVLKLICAESAVLGIAGGILGATIGWAATLILNAWYPERLHLYAGPGLLSFSVCFSAVVGTLGGLYPAVWAMRMMPMDAIRRG